jgi:hypothetical protein
MKHKFNKPTLPVEPFKRNLTIKEQNKLRIVFPEHSYSNVDKTDKILLGNGISQEVIFYITEKELLTL